MAHPRSRVENDYYPTGATLREGSSPLTRGKRHECLWARVRQGLIPAHAGKTSPPRTERGGDRAHPRSRGENQSAYRPPGLAVGSSPLTRGKHLVAVFFHVPPGLIPAHAGKTRPIRPTPTPWTAHPRSRGENLKCGFDASRGGGSSPLTRGKLQCPHVQASVRRLIPAHAGKTSTHPISSP